MTSEPITTTQIALALTLLVNQLLLIGVYALLANILKRLPTKEDGTFHLQQEFKEGDATPEDIENVFKKAPSK